MIKFQRKKAGQAETVKAKKEATGERKWTKKQYVTELAPVRGAFMRRMLER